MQHFTMYVQPRNYYINFFNTLPNDLIYYILDFISILDACNLRLVNKQVRDYVTNHCWNDQKTHMYITNFSKFRICFPRFISIDLSSDTMYKIHRIKEEEFKYLENVENLDINYNTTITDEAIKKLKKIKNIRIQGCTQLTEKIFDYEPMQKLEKLDMLRLDFSHDIFSKFRNIKSLNISCHKKVLETHVFDNLQNLEELIIGVCKFENEEVFYNLTKLKKLVISSTDITDKVFSNLNNLEYVDISNCYNITDKSFEKFTKVKNLCMISCNQETISDNGFKYLENVEKLYMYYCNQKTITNIGISSLKNVKNLVMADCNQDTITEECFFKLHKLKELDIRGCDKNIKILQLKISKNIKLNY